jgi:hypothetical protein
MKHSTKKPNKAEAARMDKMKEMGVCLACRKVGVSNPFTGYDMDSGRGGSLIEIHHLLSGNKRRGHMFTISLCPWHHRGKLPDLMVPESLMWLIKAGPALVNGSKPFHAMFGSDYDLLAEQDELLSD